MLSTDGREKKKENWRAWTIDILVKLWIGRAPRKPMKPIWHHLWIMRTCMFDSSSVFIVWNAALGGARAETRPPMISEVGTASCNWWPARPKLGGPGPYYSASGNDWLPGVFLMKSTQSANRQQRNSTLLRSASFQSLAWTLAVLTIERSSVSYESLFINRWNVSFPRFSTRPLFSRLE